MVFHRRQPSSTPTNSLRDRWRRAITVLRVIVAVVASLVSGLSLLLLGVFAFNPNGTEEFTIGRRPGQFYQVFENEERAFPDETYANIRGVAHNSGGSVEATLEALIFGADVIEVDVVEIDGVLFSAHTPPLPFLGPRLFRGPSLERVWTASYRADAMMLDLKDSSAGYVDLVARFLNSRPPGRDVIVGSRSPDVLHTLNKQAPGAILLLSVPSAEAFETFQADTALQGVIDGVTIRESILDVDMAYWLANHELLIYAWTVNDLERVNELIQLGVDGITTDNLAVLTLLGGQQPSE